MQNAYFDWATIAVGNIVSLKVNIPKIWLLLTLWCIKTNRKRKLRNINAAAARETSFPIHYFRGFAVDVKLPMPFIWLINLGLSSKHRKTCFSIFKGDLFSHTKKIKYMHRNIKQNAVIKKNKPLNYIRIV